MTLKYDLSVIIPCHNLEDYILPMLYSLEQQELNDYKVELIFVCDTCTDKTKNIIIRFAFNFLQYSAIHIIDVDYHSLGLTRNVGLDISNGKYIMFLDGDDWLINNSAFFICISGMLQHPEAQLLRFKWKSNELFCQSCNCKNNNELNNIIYGTVWQYCYDRELIGNTRFPNKMPGEDDDFSEEIFKKITSYFYIDDFLYFYNFGRPGSNMQQFFEKGFIE